MPGQARKRSGDESQVAEGELDPSTLEEVNEPAGQEGDEPVVAVEMADDDEDEDEDDEADADEEDDDEDDEDEDDEDEDEDDDDEDAEEETENDR
jgi:hypothetical protein